MKKLLIILLIFLSASCKKEDGAIINDRPLTPSIDKGEAQTAFLLLNDIRTNPGNYYQELKFAAQLDSVTRTKLLWNDTLAKVAETKAYDMADRNYVAHVDPDGYGINYFIANSGYKLNPVFTQDKSANDFESIGAGYNNGKELIKELIIDDNGSTLGHRKHLLGVGYGSNSLVDIGIGFVKGKRGDEYQTYASVVIAKHN